MTTTQYAVILGVNNADNERAASLELGTFPNATEALSAACDSLGRTVADVNRRYADMACDYYETPGAHLAVAGFTVERFTDHDGTDGDWRIEADARTVGV
jgi:predicted methyltransferase